MATDVGHAHCVWPHEDPTSRDDPQETSVSQIVDHGSISFGRYTVESLSWEKRSVFTVNRRQEELDKCSSHGLVAQKKAYFEEFYKRIRPRKTSETDQQNQITLRGDAGTYCQTAEGGTDVNAKHPGCGAIRNYDSHLEKVANETDTSEAVLSDTRENIPVSHRKLQSSPTTETLLRESSQDVKESVPIHAIHIEHFGTKPITKNPLSQSREVGKDIHDNKAVSGKNVTSLSSDELVISAEKSAAFTPQLRQQKYNSIPSENTVKKEAPQNNTNHNKQEIASVPKVKKDHAPLSRSTTKAECRNKSSHGSNPVHKQVGKADNDIHSRKTTADKPLGNDMSSSISSSRPLPERRPNVTIPHPFSFATEKRATASSRLRGSIATAPGSTRLGTNIKVPNSCPSRRLASSLPHAKDFTDVQEYLNKTATITSAKEGNVEDKRCAGSKERRVSSLGTSETRSFNLPPPKESYQFGVNNKLKNSDIKTKEKEEKSRGRIVPEVHLVSSEKTASIVSGNLKKPNQKVLLSRSMNLSVDSKKPRSINLSLDGSKPRQEKPHWR